MAIFWLLVGGLLVALLWTFGAQNARAVDLSYFGLYVIGAPLWAVAVVPAVVGLLLGFLVGLPGRVRGMMVTRRLRTQVQERDRMIAELQGRLDELQRIGGPARPAALPADAGPALPEVPDVSTGSRRSA
jgi:uncharacterized integral membrane protein